MATPFTPIQRFLLSGGTGGVLATVPVSAAGTLYTQVPLVAVTGGGAGVVATAQVRAVLTGTSVNATAVKLNGGNGYKIAPLVRVVNDPRDTTGSGATFTANITATYGSVSSLTQGAAGTLYTYPPMLIIEGGEGAGAMYTASLTGTSVASLTIFDSGSGYSVAPTVTITANASLGDTTGSGAACGLPTVTATANINSLQVEFWPDASFRYLFNGQWFIVQPTDAATYAILEEVFSGTGGFPSPYHLPLNALP